MTHHSTASHTLRIDLPIDQCQRLFTPAGEELWVDGWRPAYLHPKDGRTEPGMVFTTGTGPDFSIWTLADFDTRAHYARYVRVTPASRAGFVEVRCASVDSASTRVEVTYSLTALNDEGERLLDGFIGEAFVRMIEGWKKSIDARLAMLRDASIR